jgi:hypothetical protein
MSKCGYTAATVNSATQVTVPVALAANTAKSVLGVVAPAGVGLELKKLRVGLYGSASGTPGDIELMAATFASNAPGTASTAVTPQQVYGRPMRPVSLPLTPGRRSRPCSRSSTRSL